MSLFNTSKNELINLHYYHNGEEFHTVIEDFVYTWYNNVRTHAFNGYKTPYAEIYAA